MFCHSLGLPRGPQFRISRLLLLFGFFAPVFVGCDVRAGEPARPTLDSAAAEKFFDELVPGKMHDYDVPGAVIVVVKDGSVVFAKGYGVANLETKTPVSAEQTLFRVGSISKLLVWTAVMQLVEKHAIDLDRDVAEYLDFPPVPPGSKPVTMRQLMTHTSGYAQNLMDLIATDPAKLQPLNLWLSTHVPQITFEPGTTMSYSSYGAALAGYVVERVSHLPFEDYAEREILRPLNMTRSTFRQPLPPDLSKDLAVGYLTDRRAPPLPLEYIQGAPCGSFSCTGLDMARFMIAQLKTSDVPSGKILRPETLAEMHRTQIRPILGTNGGCFGFWERSTTADRIIGHWGNTTRFQCDLNLLPDQRTGYFLATNTPHGEWLASTVWYAFRDRFFPDPKLQVALTAPVKEDAGIVAGTYRNARSFSTNIAKIYSLVTQVDIQANGDGTISVPGNPHRYASLGGLRFREMAEVQRYGLDFARDSLGRMIMLRQEGEAPYLSFIRVPWYESKGVSGSVFAAGFFVALGTLLGQGCGYLWKKFRRKTSMPKSRIETVATTTVMVASGLTLILVVAWAVLLSRCLGESDVRLQLLSTGMLGLFRAYAVLGVMTLTCASVAAVLRVRQLYLTSPGVWRRLGYVVQGVSFLGTAWFIAHWGLASYTVTF